MLTVATDGDDDAQVAQEVRFWVGEPLTAKVPVAVYCCVVPRVMAESAGAISMEATPADVRLVDPVTVFVPVLKAAEIVAVPTVEPAVARPLLEIFATAGRLEPQATKLEMFCVAVFARVPVAVYWMVVPDAIVWSVGVAAMEARSELVRIVVAESPPNDALMFVVPVADNAALTSPCASTVAIAVLLEFHVAEEVRFVLILFE